MKKVLCLVFTLCSLTAMSQSITLAEYFFDDDPGVGLATELATASNTGALTQTFTIPTSELSDGFHSLYIRTKSSDNDWSLYDRTHFYVRGLSEYHVTAAEYFFETDPGIGNGIPLAIDAGTGVLTQTFTIPTTELSNGFHSLYIRTKSNDNDWGLYDRETFYITNFNSHTITAAEYFFDEDEGVGNGTALAVDANSGQLNQVFSIPTAGLADGFHSFYIRTQDNAGHWSLYDRQIIYIKDFDFTPDEITKAEYFIDEDPGIGSGTEVSFTDGSLSSQMINVNTTGLEVGEHRFYVRVQDSSGDWSIYDTAEFTIETGLSVDEALFKTTKIYPNPFENELTIKVNANSNLSEVKIYNNIGQVVYSSSENMKNLELSHLTSGLYILNLKTTLGQASFRIIKK